MKSKVKCTANKKAFTLIETLIAISILMLSITGPMVFAAQGLKSAMYARDQVTAFYLVQDALETLRFLRDNTAIELQDGIAINWDKAFENCYDKTCKIDTTLETSDPNSILKPCNNDDECTLFQKKGAFAYGYEQSDGVWQKTPYQRMIKIKKVVDENDVVIDNEVLVEVTIKWKSGSIPRVFTANENMFNIYGSI